MHEILVFNARPEFAFERKSETASGFDLCANLSVKRTIDPGRRWAVRCGVHLAMPPGIEAQVRPRSGLSRDHGVWTPIGTIDSDYRGEIACVLFNSGDQPFEILPGARIAQLVFSPVLLPGVAADEWIHRSGLWCPIREVRSLDGLPHSDRGASGFGSTGR